MSTSRGADSVAVDHDDLLRQNLARVFNERDPNRRSEAIAELYAADPTFVDAHGVYSGRAAISAVVGRLLAMLPPGTSFAETGPAVGHHGVARLRWRASAPGVPLVASGTDVAHIADGRIERLYVFLDPDQE